MDTGAPGASFAPIKPTWSGIDVRGFGPYHEARAAALARRVWLEPGFKRHLLADPGTVMAAELGLDLPAGRRVEAIDKSPDEFVFVVPPTPPRDELWYRYEQISGWWMFAHAMWWWMTRLHGERVAAFPNALNVQIIGRTWNDPAWRAALVERPRETLEAEIGASFPPGLTVRTIVDTPEAVHFVLPPHPREEDTDAAAEHLGGLFALSHTWWQWLVWPRLLRPADPAAVTAMVD